MPVVQYSEVFLSLTVDSDSQTRVTHSITGDVVHLQYRGAFTADDLIAAREDFIADPDFEPGMSFLVDFRDASVVNLDDSALRRVAMHGRAVAKEWGEHRTAVVAPRDLEFGVSRIFEVIGARPGLTLRVFRDMDSGTAWLSESE